MPACHMGLVWPNASDAMGMIASLSRNECALTALQNHQKMHGVPATGMGVGIAYSYCEASAQCGCLAGNDFCMIWSDLGPKGTPKCEPEPDPCWCSDYVENLINFNNSNSTSKPAPLPVPTPEGCGTKYSCNQGTGTCTKDASGNFTSNTTCASSCSLPPPPPPPPPPLSQNPCIRFGHTIPTAHRVDAMIVQESDPSINYTWTNQGFGDFSDWVNIFKPGKGTITIWENSGGKRGAKLYSLGNIPLTPGPLLATIKVAQSQAPKVVWPPSLPDNIETIAVSIWRYPKVQPTRCRCCCCRCSCCPFHTCVSIGCCAGIVRGRHRLSGASVQLVTGHYSSRHDVLCQRHKGDCAECSLLARFRLVQCTH